MAYLNHTPIKITPPAEPCTEKVVNWENLHFKKYELQDKQFTIAEKLFDGLINMPYNMFLFVRRSVSEAISALRKKPSESRAGNAYECALSGEVYLDKTCFDSDVNYALKHGLCKKFQEKSARISQQAFNECKDFGVLVNSGQLRKLDI